MNPQHIPYVHYQDEAIVVLEKPAGLLCVPGRGTDKQDCLSARAQKIWPDALVVHRLDMATSGLIVMARGIKIQRLLSSAFEQRQIYKQYEAEVWGNAAHTIADTITPADSCGRTMPGNPIRLAELDWQTIDLPIAADWEQRPLRKICAKGKESHTQWRLLQHPEDSKSPLTSRVALRPLTGRTHQLRVHMQAIGHPIVGDIWYGAHYPPSTRLRLHASELAFNHPITGLWVENHSTPPF